MHNRFLSKLYFVAPKRLKPLVERLITSRENGQMYSPTIRVIFKEKYNIEIGYGSYGGCFNYRNVPSGVKFGNYCSVAPNIRIFRANHPVQSFTSHPILYNPIAGYVTQDKLNRPPLVIGHDVWIGEGTIILPKVDKIGNGAIIGAGSVVTKDVEPYKIMAGNPAKEIGQRFRKNIITKLEATEWWNLDVKDLISNIDDLEKIALDRTDSNVQSD